MYRTGETGVVGQEGKKENAKDTSKIQTNIK